MADINSVKYEEIRAKASEIFMKGHEVKSGIGEVSKEMTQINTIWTGKKCNKFIKVWNENIEALSRYFKLLQLDLAVYLSNVARRFAQIDGEDIKGPGFGWGSGLKEIQLTDESTLRFLTTEVRQFHQRLLTKFDSSTDAIDVILAEVKALPWDSDSSSTFIPILESLSAEAKNAISNISTSLADMIDESINTAESLEGKNVQEGSSFGSSKN